MLIQGSIFEDLYISDSALEDVKRSLLLLPEVVSVNIDPDLEGLDGELVLTAFALPEALAESYNELHEKVKRIEEGANKDLGTKIYLFLEQAQ